MDLDIYAFAQQFVTPGVITLDNCFFAWREHYGLNEWITAREKQKYRWTRRGAVRLLHEAKNLLLLRDYPWFPSLRLSSADLDALEADIKSGSLLMTTGSPFGASIEHDLKFIALARAELLSGNVVLILSDW